MVYIDKPNINTEYLGISLRTKKNEENVLVESDFFANKFEYSFNLSELPSIDVGSGDFNIVEMSSTKEILSSSKVNFNSTTNDILITGIEKKILHDFTIVSKNINGSPVHLFKKLNLGDKCEVCWDSDLGSSNDSNCPSCGGKGTKITYSQPIKTYAGPIQQVGDNLVVREEGTISSYPPVSTTVPSLVLLMTDDIMYHQNSGEWYTIRGLNTSSSAKGINILQRVTMETIPTGSPLSDTALKQHGFKPNNKRI